MLALLDRFHATVTPGFMTEMNGLLVTLTVIAACWTLWENDG